MRRIALLTLFIAAVLACAGSTEAQAKIIYVDDDAPAPGDGTSWTTAYRFLQDALADAAMAEESVEIRVAQGTYKPDRDQWMPDGSGDREVFFRLDTGMSLLGGYAGVTADDPNERDVEAYRTVLSGDLAGNDPDVTDAALMRDDPLRQDNVRVIRVYGNGSYLDGCVITGGRSAFGALEIRGSVTVTHCTFSANCGNGGYPGCSGAVSLMTSKADVVFEHCTFVRNAGHYGGAIDGSDLVLANCLFAWNYAWGFGGAVSGGSITDCTFVENRARSGGAVNLSGSFSTVCTVARCVFRGNFATDYGAGAILCEGNTNIEDCLFVGNRAASYGGACHSQFGDVKLVNSILVGNQAGERGGAWSTREGSSLEIVNCTILENRAPEAAFLLVDRNSNPASSQVSVRDCVLSNGDHEISSNDSPVEIAFSCIAPEIVAQGEEDDWLVLGPGNVDADPCFVDPGYWDMNGTPDDPNDDFFVEGDYHLKSQAGRWDQAGGSWVQDEVTSPCIDAGDPNCPVGDEPFPNGGVINMGAYGGTAQASMSLTGEPTQSRWTEPVPLFEVNTETAEEWAPMLSPDGLILYFGRVRSPESDLGRIFQATRPSLSNPFTSVIEVPGPLNDANGDVLCPWVSPDGLRLYYNFQSGAVFRLQVSERSSTTDPWPRGTDLWELNVLDTRLHTPRLTADERTILFTGPDARGGAGYDIWMATRPDREAPFDEPVNLTELNSVENDIHAVPSGDGLTVYFPSNRKRQYQLYRSMRESTESAFGPPVHMAPFDTPDGDSMFPCLSADGTEFYFMRQTAGGRATRDLWVAYRTGE